ncbi:MAG: hypothetical protein V3T58_06695 [Candidatus Hydrothermarchaeales archaeon]
MGRVPSRKGGITSSGATALGNENLGDAEEFILLANRELDAVEAEYSLVRAKYDAARDNILTYIVARAVRAKHRLSDIELERQVLDDLMKRTQKKYYRETAMNRHS